MLKWIKYVNCKKLNEFFFFFVYQKEKIKNCGR